MAINKDGFLILFEDGKPEIEREARIIAERLAEQGVDASVGPASGLTIPQLLGARCYLLGADSPGADSFAELARCFKGMNLAGRKAAFFGSSGAAVAWLKGLCADSELAVAHNDLIGRQESPAIAAWLKGVLAS